MMTITVGLEYERDLYGERMSRSEERKGEGTAGGWGGKAD
jgi:hypothetical protein